MTPEQLERRRVSRERWRERNPSEWLHRRGRGRSGRVRQDVPDALPDVAPDADLVAEVAALRARLEAALDEVAALQDELLELRAYRQRDIERSRRNREHRTSDRTPTGRDRTRPDGGPAVRPAPLARRAVSSPGVTDYPGVFLTTTTTPGPVANSAGVVVPNLAPHELEVWKNDDVQAALNRRPGLDVELLRAKVNDWLAERDGRLLSVRTVLSFIDRWRPALDETPPRPAFRQSGRPDLAQLAADPSLDWIDEAQASAVAEQDRMLAAAGFKL